MGKEVRTGTSYHCGISADDFSDIPLDCASSGGPSFTFRNSAGDKITYRINSGRIERVLNGDPASSLVLTSSDTNITSLTFYVVGAYPKAADCTSPGPNEDCRQPRATIVLRGTAGLKEKIKSHLNIQTTISQRMIDS